MVFGLFKNINLVGTVDLLVECKISHLKLEFSFVHAPPKLATCFRPCLQEIFSRYCSCFKSFMYTKEFEECQLQNYLGLTTKPR